MSLFKDIKLLTSYRTLFLQMTMRDFLQKYKGSSLGVFWAFVHPLLILAVYAFVFIGVFKLKWGQTLDHGSLYYTLMIFCALIPFTIFSDSANRSILAITQNPNMVKKVVMPLEILPLSLVVSSTLSSLFSMLLLVLLKVLLLATSNWVLVFIPLLYVPVIFLTAGVSLLLSALGVYLRDLTYVIGIGINILFYLSPIFYSSELIPNRFRWLVNLNPIAPIIEEFRRCLVDGQMINMTSYGQVSMVALLVFFVGYSVFHFLRKGFADVI